MYTTANDVRLLSATAFDLSTSALRVRLYIRFIIEFARKVRQIACASTAHAERGFAKFAKIPYCDAVAQSQLIEILDELQNYDEEQEAPRGVHVIRYPLANRVLMPRAARRSSAAVATCTASTESGGGEMK
jgi:hypothetical protein